MGMDVKGPEPDPRHWAQCSCGVKLYGPDQEETINLIKLHFQINKESHTTGSSTGYYMLHIPPKRKWWKRTFGKHEGKDL